MNTSINMKKLECDLGAERPKPVADALGMSGIAEVLARIEANAKPHTAQERAAQLEHRKTLVARARRVLETCKKMAAPPIRSRMFDNLTVFTHDISMEILGSCSCGTKSAQGPQHAATCMFRELSECEELLYEQINTWQATAKKIAAQ